MIYKPSKGWWKRGGIRQQPDDLQRLSLKEEINQYAVPWATIEPYVLRARQGDHHATRVVFASSYAMILHWVASYTRHDTYVPDLIQRACGGVYSTIRTWDPTRGSWGSALKCWVRAVCRKEMDLQLQIVHTPEWRHCRSAYTLYEPLENIQGTDQEELRNQPAPPTLAIQEEHATIIASRVEKLKDPYRTILRMRYGINTPMKTLQEVAHHLNRPRLWVRQAELRAMRMLELVK